ncbi:MAG: ABC transporter permease, partial [Endomicrobium sp.]|nr:ABC transporter permease [Endomicrobium sp.]
IVAAAFVLMFVIILLSLIIPLTGDYQNQNIDMAKQTPSLKYWFGSDQLGRDMWLRIWLGARTSLLIAAILVFFEVLIGLIYGAVSGYFGGRLDNILQRFVDIFMNVPYIVMASILILILNQGFWTVILSLGIFGWLGLSKLVRAQVLKYKELEFVLAARSLGSGHSRILFKHCLPNMMSALIIALTFAFPGYILAEAFLSVLSLGLPIGSISLGILIIDNIASLQTEPYLLFIPLAILLLITLSFNIIGNGLRDALDPRTK